MCPSELHIPLVVTNPMNSCTYFWLFGGFMLTMDSYFLFIIWISLWVIQKPRCSISVCLKNYFLILHLISFNLRSCSVSSIFPGDWNNQPWRLSTIRQCTPRYLNPQKMLFVFSRKISREFLTPIGRSFYG